MAEALRFHPLIRIPVWEPYVTLMLSKEEAQALYDVARGIGGDPETTRRGYFSGKPSAILEVLEPYVTKTLRNSEVRDKHGETQFI